MVVINDTQEKQTPLHGACIKNHIEIANMLISAGADLNLANKVCNTINILNFSMIIESFILIF